MLGGGHGIVRKTYCDRCGTVIREYERAVSEHVVWHRDAGMHDDFLHFYMCSSCDDDLIANINAHSQPVSRRSEI